MFTRILVPLDGTAESNSALPLARTVARATGGSITLLRVLPSGDQATSVAKRDLERIAAELQQSEVAVTAEVAAGDPAHEILELARKQQIELILMRTHGRSGLGRTVMGSVAEKVLSGTQIPIMLMRPGARRISAIRTLLVPLDGSPGAAVALATAVGLARSANAALRLVEAIVPIPMQVWAGYGGYMYYDPAWDDEARDMAQNYVSAMTTRLHDAGLQVTGATREGPVVADCIVDEADFVSADLIVMSTHALKGVARAVLGSVADMVVRTANCPVLLIHRGDSTISSEVESTTPELVTI